MTYWSDRADWWRRGRESAEGSVGRPMTEGMAEAAAWAAEQNRAEEAAQDPAIREADRDDAAERARTQAISVLRMLRQDARHQGIEHPPTSWAGRFYGEKERLYAVALDAAMGEAGR